MYVMQVRLGGGGRESVRDGGVEVAVHVLTSWGNVR